MSMKHSTTRLNQHSTVTSQKKVDASQEALCLTLTVEQIKCSMKFSFTMFITL